MDYAVDRLGWAEVIHCIEDDNVASIRVAERLGSRRLRRRAVRSRREPSRSATRIEATLPSSMQWMTCVPPQAVHGEVHRRDGGALGGRSPAPSARG